MADNLDKFLSQLNDEEKAIIEEATESGSIDYGKFYDWENKKYEKDWTYVIDYCDECVEIMEKYDMDYVYTDEYYLDFEADEPAIIKNDDLLVLDGYAVTPASIDNMFNEAKDDIIDRFENKCDEALPEWFDEKFIEKLGYKNELEPENGDPYFNSKYNKPCDLYINYPILADKKTKYIFKLESSGGWNTVYSVYYK